MAAMLDEMEVAGAGGNNGAAVAPPLPPVAFPEAEIRGARIEPRIIIDERGLDIERRDVLVLSNGPMYYLLRTLRKAIYGSVIYACKVDATDDPQRVMINRHVKVAIKMMSLQLIAELAGRHAENPMSEVACMNFLRQQGGHRHVLTYTDLCQTDTHMFLVLPYCNGGELFGIIEEQGKLDAGAAQALFRQMVDGVAFLGRASVCHRDLSLENMLVHTEEGADSLAIVIDFGMALRVPRDAQNRAHLINALPYAGKLNYSAPEIVAQQDFDGSKIDVWALGVMLFIMLVGIPPWTKATRNDPRYLVVVTGRLRVLLQHWNVTLPEAAINLLERIFVEDIGARISVEEIKEHPFYTGR